MPVRTRTIYGFAKCKRCKTIRRVEGSLTIQEWTDNRGYIKQERRERWPELWCTGCRRIMPIDRISGRTSDHECDARCINATGCQCECSCGGMNHGRAHA